MGMFFSNTPVNGKRCTIISLPNTGMLVIQLKEAWEYKYDIEGAVKSVEQVVWGLLLDGAKDCVLLVGFGRAGGLAFCEGLGAGDKVTHLAKLEIDSKSLALASYLQYSSSQPLPRPLVLKNSLWSKAVWSWCQSNDSLAYVNGNGHNVDDVGGSDESSGDDSGQLNVSGEEEGRGEDMEATIVDELRELLQKAAMRELEVAWLNSTIFEEKTQRISEAAIALQDKAEIVNEECVAKEAVQKATMSLALSEARLQVVVESLKAAKRETYQRKQRVLRGTTSVGRDDQIYNFYNSQGGTKIDEEDELNGLVMLTWQNDDVTLDSVRCSDRI
ncbi:K(+) efflux antiporter 2, chloroplastic [Morella rubra]|uniref:K(+) efflux antiporter 2, chloroplastic n=1 Tax=Morella rubra TaxID=262757 RepID=A0A6A1V7T0_9ROSI|nr:K(+) efflux antiporter 2, chloroplastic [Morella rubra]